MKKTSRDQRALERFVAVSTVIARVTGGMSLSRAITEVTKSLLIGLDGHPLTVSRASLYRWHVAFSSKKFSGLEEKPRAKVEVSRVLPQGDVVLVGRRTRRPNRFHCNGQLSQRSGLRFSVSGLRVSDGRWLMAARADASLTAGRVQPAGCSRRQVDAAK